jgi:hypothetical protein
MMDARQLYEVGRELHGRRLREAEGRRMVRMARAGRRGQRGRVSERMGTALIALGVALRGRTQAATR